MSERVFVVPAALVTEAAAGRACWSDGARADDAWVEALEAAGEFAARDEVESDESRRQVIPYLLLKSAAGGYFTYQRLPQGGEQRLFGMHSIGVGGHINDDRCHPGLAFESPVLRPKWVAEGLQRELAEELVLPPTGAHGLGRLRLHGFLALNETPVDRVHVGVVVVVELAPGREHECRVNEDDRLRPVGWLTSAELARQARDVTFEGWSRALIAAGLP